MIPFSIPNSIHFWAKSSINFLKVTDQRKRDRFVVHASGMSADFRPASALIYATIASEEKIVADVTQLTTVDMKILD
jgi:hypothetical protein